MNLIALLEQAIIEKFKAEAILKSLEDAFTYKLKRLASNMYLKKNIYFIDNGRRYDLYAVKTSASFEYGEEEVKLSLYYVINEKLDARKSKRVEVIKSNLDKDMHPGWDYFKIDLYREYRYRFSPKEVINGVIDLDFPTKLRE